MDGFVGIVRVITICVPDGRFGMNVTRENTDMAHHDGDGENYEGPTHEPRRVARWLHERDSTRLDMTVNRDG
jgi:hypothetical protein